ncbi:MAG: hypothetical protein JNK30_00690 [Phenylobacterium sp.]|uniref:C45 family autoproteolytic acyltransferase/hydolase n=1 Tax=Phenylobacterium sp. TaxID=1871053 RepID=UPI001A368C0F|nr:C45 family peptidase [Phenylobacterium sp.]MBL8769870.1 hypothetical protein [Phenylobacterium sp.]
MLQIVDMAGDARTRGVACGRALAGRIAAHMADWERWLAAATGRPGLDYVRAMVRDTDYRTAIAAHTPDLMEEVQGLAEGAGADPDLVYGLQLMDEEWFYRGRAIQKCTSFAVVEPGGDAWIGQNMDLGAYTDGHQVMLRIAADGDRPAALVFTTAGVIGLMGVNDAGVGVCVNSLPQLPAAPHGLPVAFVLRRLLQARSVTEAAELACTLPHATNQHYVIAGPGAVRAFETSSAGVVEYMPPDPARVFHTNHPLSDVEAAPESEAARRNSVRRLASVTARLAQGRPGLPEYQAALCARDDPEHPVCREGGGNIGFTCGAMIARVAPGEVEAWASPGPPRREGFTAVGF